MVNAMRKINVLGICLKDYTLKEALQLADGYMQKNGAVHTIAYISSQLLIAADGSSEWKEWIESLDMTICTDADVLCADGGMPKSRISEIEENAFLVEFLKKAAKEGRRICLLADTKEKLALLQENLLHLQENLPITGSFVLGMPERAAAFINEANDIVPDVIISELPAPWQKQLLLENKKKINTRIWLALPEGGPACIRRQSIGKRLMQRIYRKIFKKRVKRYHNGKK